MQNIPKKLILSHALPPNDTYTQGLDQDKSSPQLIDQLDVPHLRRILKLSKPVHKASVLHDALNTPAEMAAAQGMGWNLEDGELPFAALKAVEFGLLGTTKTVANHWAFITLCSWHVQHGQVTFSADANALGLTRSESEEVLTVMKPYFEEDFIHIISHPQLPPGQWLAYSDHFDALSSASVNRVSGRVIDDFLIGTGKSSHHKSARTLRRLQNEMQMLLYQHPINDHRPVGINSFWISGTGAIQANALQNTKELYSNIQVVDFSSKDMDILQPLSPQWVSAWSAKWEEIDATMLPHYLDAFLNAVQDTQISLCNDTACITLAPLEISWTRRLKTFLRTSKISRSLNE